MTIHQGNNPLGIEEEPNREPTETTEFDQSENTEAERRAKAREEALDEAAAAIEAQGVIEEGVVSMRSFAPYEWLLQQLAGKPAGTELAIGLLQGYVTEFAREPSMLPRKPGEEPLPESIRLKGRFEATSYQTGEIVRAGACFLPPIMANQVEKAITAGSLSIQLDCEIMAIATSGRSGVPIRYRARSFFADDEAKIFAARRLRRLKSLGRDKVIAKLEGPKEG
jgi:hypothetical protein